MKKQNNTLKMMKTKKLDGYMESHTMNMRFNYLVEYLVIPQMNEIESDRDFYIWCLMETGLYKVIQNQQVNTILVWILFMSNKKIVKTYIEKFNKPFLNVCPWSDIWDLYSLLMFYHFYKKQETCEGLKKLLKLGLLSEIDQETFSHLKPHCS